MSRFAVWMTLIACTGSMAAYAGLTLPSTVLWGTITINGQQAVVPTGGETPTKVTVRLNGNDLATYSLGDRAALGNNFAVTIPMESLADGSAASSSRARVGDTVEVLVTYDDNGSPVTEAVATQQISQLGQVINLNLIAAPSCPGDLVVNGVVDAGDLEVLLTCMAGSGVGTPPGGCSGSQFGLSDLNIDGAIDLADYAMLQTLVGPCP
jgi:hypothetical protein